MNCSQFSDYIMRYLDGELDDSEYSQLIHHINKCSVCCEEFQQYSSIFKTLEKDKSIEPPENFEVEVMNKVRLIDEAAKKRKEKRIVLLYLLFSIILSMGIVICSVVFKDFILEFMKYVGIPTEISYSVYGIFRNLEYTIKTLVRIGYCFNSMLGDIYYMFIGLFVIAAISRVYNTREIKNEDMHINAAQNE